MRRMVAPEAIVFYSLLYSLIYSLLAKELLKLTLAVRFK